MGDTERQADFSAYVEARQRRLVRFAYLLTGDAHEAEDLVQAALLKVYRRWHSVYGSPDAYVRRAIVNEHHSSWRRPSRRREVADSDLVSFTNPAAAPDHHDDHELRARIAALPKQQRAVIVLRYYEDLTEAQTADVLGCSVGTVKSHASRALAALRVTMKETLA